MTSTTDILGHQVALNLLLDDAPAQEPMLREIFRGMADIINGAAAKWSAEQAEVFRLTNELTIFRVVQYGTMRLTRSFMAQKERVFYWAFDEFIKWEPAKRRPTAYFHDAWHVHQYLTQGPAPNDDKILIDREQDAIAQQLEVAGIVGCDQSMIDWLTAYAEDRQRIKERLSSGLGMSGTPGALQEHFLILE